MRVKLTTLALQMIRMRDGAFQTGSLRFFQGGEVRFFA
jgi:hypothetical protein